MDKYNHLDQLPLAELDGQQLANLQKAEAELNLQGESVYLLALKKQDTTDV
ncbi:hypothetical protein ACQCN2_20285 [Brevibacillus ginsengisoli]|uniref:hypothetical protein n=1 Tax=Brevibacillus ginsengisoli TaxID=363854 RepID=UPI003CE6D1A9